MYEKSYMHRDTLTHVVVRRRGCSSGSGGGGSGGGSGAGRDPEAAAGSGGLVL
jgi:hypothetical protein